MTIYKLIGLYNPLDMKAGFSFPIFEKENCYYTQTLNKKNVIIRFDLCYISKIKITTQLDEFNFMVGSEGVFCFYFSPSDIIFDTKNRLKNILKNRISEFELKPFIIYEIADFIFKNEINKKEKNNYKQIRLSANKNCELTYLKTSLKYLPRKIKEPSDPPFILNLFDQNPIIPKNEILQKITERLKEETNYLYDQWSNNDEADDLNSIYHKINTYHSSILKVLNSKKNRTKLCKKDINEFKCININQWLLTASCINLSDNSNNYFLNWIKNGITDKKWNTDELYNILKNEKLEKITEKNILVNIAAQALKTASILFDGLKKRLLLKPFITELKSLDTSENWDHHFLYIAGKCAFPNWGAESLPRLFLKTAEDSDNITIQTSSIFFSMLINGNISITYNNSRNITIVMSKNDYSNNIVPMEKIEKDILKNPYFNEQGRACVKSHILTNNTNNSETFNSLRKKIVGECNSSVDYIIKNEFFNYIEKSTNCFVNTKHLLTL